MSSASPVRMVTPRSSSFRAALASWWSDWSMRVMLAGSTPARTIPMVEKPVPPPMSHTFCPGPRSPTARASSRMSSVQWPGFTTTS